MTRTCTVIFLPLVSWTPTSVCASSEPAGMRLVKAKDIERGHLNPVRDDPHPGALNCWASAHAVDAVRMNRLNNFVRKRRRASFDAGGGFSQ